MIKNWRLMFLQILSRVVILSKSAEAFFRKRDIKIIIEKTKQSNNKKVFRWNGIPLYLTFYEVLNLKLKNELENKVEDSWNHNEN